MENKIDDTNKHDTTSDNDKNDIERLNKLISRKDKSGYAHAIDVWTVRDVNKRNIAK